jgi:uroporphyrin-III C-methyltransferase
MLDCNITPKVFFIGAGPGSPDLITVKGLKILQQAHVVLYDALIDVDILQYCPQAILHNVGKRCGKHTHSQTEINTLLLQVISNFKFKDSADNHTTPIIVRLKGGDSTIFARLQEEIDLLKQANISFEIIPGVTAASAAAAALNISLTQRGISRALRLVTLATGAKNSMNNIEDIKNVQDTQDTFVFYMGKHQLKNIAAYLNTKHIHKDSYIYLIENVSLKNQRIYETTFEQLHDEASYARMLAWIHPDSALLIVVKR